MPVDIGSFGITVPCLSEPISCAALQDFALDSDAALVSVEANVTTALLRPAVRVNTPAGVAYTAGVGVIIPFTNARYDTTGMFNIATPTDLRPTANGRYLVVANASANMTGTNTAWMAEILHNGTTVAAVSTGPGVTGGQQPPTPMSCSALISATTVDTFRLRITVAGVGNDNTFSELSATLVA